MTPWGSRLSRDLSAGRFVSDQRFDRVFPQEIRIHSKVHFTPVAVAVRAREWLGPDPGLRLLDVGSGCGKFCLLVGATGPGRISGVEQRPNLVQAAEVAVDILGLRNVTFSCGRMEDFEWRGFNAFYFFNPFYERIAYRKGIDDRTPPHAGLYFDHVRTVRAKLDEVKSGARVITYHGMGGRLPSDWVLVRSEAIHTDELQLWVKE